MYSFLHVCVKTGSHKSDTSGQMRLGQVSSHLSFFIKKEGGKPMGLDGYSSQRIFFLSPNFCCLPLFVFPTGGQLCVVLCTRPWPFLLPCGFFVFCVLSLCFFPCTPSIFSPLSLAQLPAISPPHSHPPSISLYLCLFPFAPYLSLSPCPFSFPSLPPFLSRSLTRTHTHTSFSHSDAHILTLLQCLIFSLFHGLPFPAH